MKVSTRFWTFGTQKATTTSASWRVQTPPISVAPVRLSISTTSAARLVQQLPSQPLEEGFAMEVPVNSDQSKLCTAST